MLGTNIPSITSRWIQSAPALSVLAISSPSLEKSADRIEGDTLVIGVLMGPADNSAFASAEGVRWVAIGRNRARRMGRMRS